MSTRRFDGAVAIVTGGGTGLGPVLAERLVEEGARVVLAGRRAFLLEEVAARLGPAVLAVPGDLTREEDVVRLVATAVEAFGQVDVLLNNAAQPGADRWIWEQSLDNWNDTIAVDLTAAMLCSREVVRQSMLERRRGAIVSFSSTASVNGMVRKSHYVVAKAALRSLTKVLALELGEHGIRANCVVPGMMDTEAYRRWVTRIAGEDGVPYAEKEAQILGASALGTISTPDDVARTALFLASDDARTITGQSVVVDAGAVMSG